MRTNELRSNCCFFVTLLHVDNRLHLLGHSHPGWRGEESNAGRHSTAEEVQRNLTLHHPQLQDRGSTGEGSLHTREGRAHSTNTTHRCVFCKKKRLIPPLIFIINNSFHKCRKVTLVSVNKMHTSKKSKLWKMCPRQFLNNVFETAELFHPTWSGLWLDHSNGRVSFSELILL